MKFSVSLCSGNGDKYYVYLSPLNESLRRDLELEDSQIEVYQIVLDREKGELQTNFSILSDISEFIAKVFEANNNLILYYVCDDLNEIPSGNHKIPSQEYRSRLFSLMFERYLNVHKTVEATDTPIVIRDAVGQNQYVHIIARKKHAQSVLKIVDFVIEGFATGK